MFKYIFISTTIYINEVYTQVNIRTKRCSNYADSLSMPSCVKAIVVRTGKYVFIIDLDTDYVNVKLWDDGVLCRHVKCHGKYTYKVWLTH